VSNIESFGVLGAALGSLISLLFNDRFGRLISYRIYALVWATGLIVQIFSSGKYGLLLFARVWGGLGAGGLSVITSLFLSEIAPARSRGLVISCGMFFLLSFLSLGLWHYLSEI
jgi:MFS family permease